jgi:orotate phosphoribosyltransferase
MEGHATRGFREAEPGVMRIFRDAGVLKEGHFVLTSGLHSGLYWEKFRILQYPEYTGKLCALMAGRFSDRNPSVVVGPTTGGIILSYETARQLCVRGVFAEKDGDKRVLRRDFAITPGERVLVVDDILTTGKSVFETLDAVRTLGGDVIGVAVLVDRSEKEIDFGAELFSCLKAPTEAYPPEQCPLCAAGVPLSKPGGG